MNLCLRQNDILFMVECDKYDDDSLVFYFSGSSAEIKDNVGRCLGESHAACSNSSKSISDLLI